MRCVLVTALSVLYHQPSHDRVALCSRAGLEAMFSKVSMDEYVSFLVARQQQLRAVYGGVCQYPLLPEPPLLQWHDCLQAVKVQLAANALYRDPVTGVLCAVTDKVGCCCCSTC